MLTGSTRFRLLGPLRFWDGTAWTGVPAAQQRTVLAVLLSEAGRVVATDRLIDELWGEHPPKAASAVVRGYVMWLRRRLGSERAPALVTRDRGYELAVGPAEVDAVQFETLVNAGRRALAGGQSEVALARLSEGLALWRGPALGDVPDVPAISAYARRLEHARLSALEDYLQLRVQAGDHDEALAELEPLVQQHPLRERCWELLMLALHRCGRRADALEAYRRARHALVAGLGLEPGQQLRDLQHAILSGDDGSAAPLHLPPAQLPPDVAGFAGRRAQLDALDKLLHESARLISVTGTAGAGKSALAVHWAHRVRERFPDGQLYLNLRGFDPTGSPMSEAEAVRGLLDALRVPAERIPTAVQSCIGLYRTLMAEKRVLIVLDNAGEAAVVRSLLPAAPGCLVITTSREDLHGLIITDGAEPVALDLMSTQDACDLLASRIGRDRVAREPQAADEIIERCSRLPLALAVVAARAVTRPGFSLEALAGELRDGLEVLSGGETATDPRAVFSWSYRALDEQTARLFRLLGLHPGPDIGTAAVASLAGLTAQRARAAMARLVRASLVAEPEPGRYTWHDLLRGYARQLVYAHDDEPLRQAALHRMTDHYLHTAHAAAMLFEPLRDPIRLETAAPASTVEHLADRGAALDWLRREHTVLLRVVQQAASAGFDRETGRLAWCLAQYLEWQGHWADFTATQEAALGAATRSRDTALWVAASRQLARAQARMGRLEAADITLRAIIDVGGPVDRADALFTLGMVKMMQTRYADALGRAVSAHELFEANGDRAGQARALNLIGWSQAHLGRFGEAIEHCGRALALAQGLGYRSVEANAWDSLGFAHHSGGDMRAGIVCYERSLAILRELGHRQYEADTLVRIADAFHTLGDRERAHAAWRDAIDIFDHLGHSTAAGVRERLASCCDHP